MLVVLVLLVVIHITRYVLRGVTLRAQCVHTVRTTITYIHTTTHCYIVYERV